MNKGKLFIISGPSGSGKDTLLQELFKVRPEIKFSISSITRPMRQGEVEGGKYHFISREEFEELIKNDALLEYNIFVGNYYGTPKAPVVEALDRGEDMILELDVNGAALVKQKMPEAISVFIMPPSFEVLKNRLSGRGTEAPEVVQKRLNVALGEIKRAADYDFIVVNDKLNEATNDLLSVILGQKLKTESEKDIIDEVLKQC